MNLEETQKLESLDSCAVTTSGTLILNDENKIDASSEPQSDVIKLVVHSESIDAFFFNLTLLSDKFKKQKLLANSPTENGHSLVVDTKSTSFRMSNYCLKFTETNQIYPLSIGLNKIGRAESSEICILNKVSLVSIDSIARLIH